MSDLSHVDDYPEIPVSLHPSRDALKTGVWRSMRPIRIDRVAPCVAGCPASVPVPRFFHHLAAGDVAEAFAVFSLRNPFPAITGRVCPHSCEHDCNRRTSGASLSIRAVERFLGDVTADLPHPGPVAETGTRVAVIGSGPEGLAAAYYLRRSGHHVVVFERRQRPGGLLRYAIPEYRLPEAILDAEIDRLAAMGVRFHTGVSVDDETVDDLRGTFDCIYEATGSWEEARPDIPGADLLESGMAFLARAAHSTPLPPGRHCAIVGGGDTGIDVARLLRRLDVDVTVIFEGSTREIPAMRESYYRAMKEGVQFSLRTRTMTVAADGGQRVLTLQDARTGDVEEATYDAVFVGADAVSGTATVATAIAAGRRGADAVNALIGGGYPVPEWLEPDHDDDIVDVDEVNPAYVVSRPRVREHDADSAAPFAEESLTVSEEEALAEIERCLSCGFCNECGTCYVFCPDAAIRWEDGPVIEYEHCKGCGICVTECPGHSFVFVEEREPEHV